MKVQVKTHWYKIKVKKTGMTYIDITGLGNKSKISVTVTGAARLKNKTISKGFRIYGKAKKELTILRSKRIQRYKWISGKIH